MSIKLNTFKKGRCTSSVNKASGTAIAKDTILAYSAGLAIPATSATTRDLVAGIANQEILAGDALTTVEVLEIDENDVFVMDTTNNSNVLHNGQLMVLSSAGVANNTGTTAAAGLVQQVGVVGEAADKKIIVKFAKLV